MKKTLALCLSIMMVLSMLPVFAHADGDKIKIVYMDWDSSIASRETEWQIFLENNPDFADKVDIEVISGGNGEGDELETMRKLVASGQKDEMPDIFTCNWAQVPEYYSMGICEDLGPVYAELGDQILDGVVTLMQYDNFFMGFPVEIKTKIWAYRIDMFEAAGVNPADVKTLDEYIEAGKKIKAIYPDTYVENYTSSPYAYDLYMRLTANGGVLHDENGEFCASTDPGVREAFINLKEMMESDVVNSDISDFSSDWYAALNDGTICSQLGGNWFAANHLVKNCPDMAGLWGCALWPEEMAVGSENGAKLAMINKDSPNKDLCIEIMKRFCYDPDFAYTLFTSIRQTVPYLKVCAEDPKFNVGGAYYGPDRMAAEFEAMKILKVYPYTINGTAEQTIITRYLGEYLSGTMDLDTALKSAEEEMKIQIGNAFY